MTGRIPESVLGCLGETVFETAEATGPTPCHCSRSVAPLTTTVEMQNSLSFQFVWLIIRDSVDNK